MAKRVLVIEGDAGLREAVQEALARAGYAASVATDGEAGWQALNSQPPPDAVLLELVLPRRSGPAVLAALRAAPALNHLPVVVMSADPDPPPPAGLGGRGPAALLVKPFPLGELLNTVSSLIGRP